ncbi:MAG: bacteriophage abortive infection AbiH family protein [Clostridia bacterium]|nr:bacteriophage abortive infection AbiH family protein [Clostridia bacterium]
MSKLIIIGNGFDLAHKIPTSYNHFRKYLIDKYPEAYRNKDRIINIDEIEDMELIAVEIMLYAIDHANGEDWANFESSLSIINFKDKFPRHEHREDPDEDNSTAAEYLMYIMSLTEIFNNCVALWGELLSDWIKEIERSIENYDYDPIDSICNLLNGDVKIMTFNYTKTVQILYGKSGVKHIHNRVGQELIFGHSNISPTYQEDGYNSLGSNFLDDILKILYKDTEKQFSKYSDFFRKIGVDINEIYSYGFSYGMSDSSYIKFIIDKVSENAIWNFTKYDSTNKEFMRRTKIKLRKWGFKGQFCIYE